MGMIGCFVGGGVRVGDLFGGRESLRGGLRGGTVVVGYEDVHF